jgi:hypothetical protein
MPIATLEEIRLLSNLETERHKLLQIVLFGQPELDENLRQTSIRQLRERITHSFRLLPLSADEIREYLSFRLHAAGYRGPELFSKRVIDEIARVSGGLTRRVNIVADKALLAAFAENTHTVTLEHVRTAVRDSEFSAGQAPRRRATWAWWVAAVVLLGLGAAGAWWYLDGLFQPIPQMGAGPAPENPTPARGQEIPRNASPEQARATDASAPEASEEGAAADPEDVRSAQPVAPESGATVGVAGSDRRSLDSQGR